MKILKIFILLLILFPFNSSLAQIGEVPEIEIKVESQNSFQVGDTLQFSYTIISDRDVDIKYIPYILCEQAPQTFLVEEEISLKANQSYQESYKGIEIDDKLESQTCIASIQITNPIEKTEEKEFKVETSPSLDFKLKLCQDKDCSKTAKVFVLGNMIYLDYVADTQNLKIKTSLIYPDKTSKEINLPTAITAEQNGNYQIEVNVEKQGFKSIDIKDMFGVIGEEPKIKSVVVCNIDGICSGEENEQNCPQDCVKTEKVQKEVNPNTKTFNLQIIFFIIFIALIILIMVLAYVFLIRKKPKSNNQK